MSLLFPTTVVSVSFQSTELVPDMTVGKTCLGIDAGIESFVATSRGDLIKAPRFLLKVQSQLKLLQRRLKRKTKGSSNWLKLQEKISRLHEKVSNTRFNQEGLTLLAQICQGVTRSLSLVKPRLRFCS